MMKPRKASLTSILDDKSEKVTTQSANVTTVKADTIPETPLPAPNSTDKKRLPKIIIITYDKEGKVNHKEYTCAEMTVYENAKTIFSGAKPTLRKDYMDISIEAKVVEV